MKKELCRKPPAILSYVFPFREGHMSMDAVGILLGSSGIIIVPVILPAAEPHRDKVLRSLRGENGRRRNKSHEI